MHIEALFGKVLARMTYTQAEQLGLVVPIEVRMVNLVLPEIGYTTEISKEKNGYWHNDARNELIAKAARSFPTNYQILIVVKTVEHGLELKSMLPDFQLVHSGITDLRWECFARRGLVLSEQDKAELKNPDVNKLKADFKEGRLLKAIATPLWKQGVDFPQLRVLIRADGTIGSIPAIQIPGRLSRIEGNKEKGILVDFMDDFGQVYKGRSFNRIKHYKKQGWIIKYWIPTGV
jgi:superfamily II DNA/RNA helicase